MQFDYYDVLGNLRSLELMTLQWCVEQLLGNWEFAKVVEPTNVKQDIIPLIIILLWMNKTPYDY